MSLAEQIEATANRLPRDESTTVPAAVVRDCIADVNRFLAELAEIKPGFDRDARAFNRVERSLKSARNALSAILTVDAPPPETGLTARMALLNAARVLDTPTWG